MRFFFPNVKIFLKTTFLCMDTETYLLAQSKNYVHTYVTKFLLYQMSLCSHDLSIMHSCHQCQHLCTAVLATGLKIEN